MGWYTFFPHISATIIVCMHVYSKDTDTVIFREHDTQVYENKNANPEEEMVFCYQNCSDLLWEKIVPVFEKNFWKA